MEDTLDALDLPHVHPFLLGDAARRSCGAAETRRCSHLTSQLLYRPRPLGVVTRFSRAEVDSQRAELRRARRLGRPGIDLGAPGDLKIDETRRDYGCLELCIQQSAGDSTLPEVDVLLALLRHRFLYDDVADLKTTVRLEDAGHLLESGKLVRKKVEHAVRDHDVGPTVGHRK